LCRGERVFITVERSSLLYFLHTAGFYHGNNLSSYLRIFFKEVIGFEINLDLIIFKVIVAMLFKFILFCLMT
jgi:hypothetical protein